MKIFYSMFLLSTLISVHTQSMQQKLVLYFDVNKTIIATDAVQGKNLTDIINGVLAEFTFHRWDGKNNQSYYDFISDQIIKEQPQFLRASEEFKKERESRLKGFSEYLKKNKPGLYNQYEKEKKRMIDILGAGKAVIFPAFYKLLEWLEHNYKDRYVVHLRTFGIDLPEIVPLIEQRSNITFAARGGFKGETLRIFKDKFSHDQSNVIASYDSPQEIYKLFTNAKNYAVQDDYAYWKSKNFKQDGGKLFPIDLTDSQVISMFFDDNANDINRPIIHPISPTGQLHDVKKLINSGNIVPVNPKEAILNQNYFIERVQAKTRDGRRKPALVTKQTAPIL